MAGRNNFNETTQCKPSTWTVTNPRGPFDLISKIEKFPFIRGGTPHAPQHRYLPYFLAVPELCKDPHQKSWKFMIFWKLRYHKSPDNYPK